MFRCCVIIIFITLGHPLYKSICQLYNKGKDELRRCFFMDILPNCYCTHCIHEYIFCCIRIILMVLSSLREFWNIITYLYSQGINEDTSLFRMSKVVPTIYQTNMIWKIPNLFNWKLLFMSAYLRDIDYFSNWRLQEGQKSKRIYGQLQMCVWCISLSWGQ